MFLVQRDEVGLVGQNVHRPHAVGVAVAGGVGLLALLQVGSVIGWSLAEYWNTMLCSSSTGTQQRPLPTGRPGPGIMLKNGSRNCVTRQ